MLRRLTAARATRNAVRAMPYIERIIKQHRELDKNEKAKKIQKPYAKAMGEERDRRERSIERLEKKLEKLNTFLKIAEPKKGVSVGEVQSNVIDNESALIYEKST